MSIALSLLALIIPITKVLWAWVNNSKIVSLSIPSNNLRHDEEESKTKFALRSRK